MSKRERIQTSVDAYKSLVPEQLNDTYKKILSALAVLNEATTEEISAYLKMPHSVIWKRPNELHKMQLIYRPGNKRMLKSGRSGYTWMLCNPAKTDEQAKEVTYKPTQKTSTDYAKDIIKQAELFQG